MSEIFIPHEPLPLVAQEAKDMGLHLPTIEIAQRLVTRLARHQSTLEIDDIALFNGTKQAEIEDPVTVKIDAVPKDSRRPRTAITFEGDPYEGTARAHMQINPVPEKTLKGIRKVNAALWLGVLVGEELAEGHLQYPKHPGIPSNGVRYTGMVGSSFAANIGAHLVEVADHANSFARGMGGFWVNLGVGIVAGMTFNHGYINHFKLKGYGIDKLQKSHRKEAEELGKEFTVINYGVKFL